MFIKIFAALLLSSLTSIFGQSLNFNNSALIDSDWDFYLDIDWPENSRPTIELGYGLTNIKHKLNSGNFSKPGLAEMNLGYSSIDYYLGTSILEMHDKLFLGSFVSTELKSNTKLSSDIDTEIWRFGFNSRAGFGYEIGQTAILLYNTYGYTWSKLSSSRPQSILQSDVNILDRYEDNFRFGSQSEGGIQIVFSQFISLNAAYEASVIYPRLLFWKWAVSYSINRTGDGIVAFFVEEIMDSSPAAGPIFNFLLQNGFAYGFYLLQRENMNWPLASESPLTYESFKVGLTFRF